MIIHKLIAHHLAHRDDPQFYTLQARDAIAWMERHGVNLKGVSPANRQSILPLSIVGTDPFKPAPKALDLGAGHGIFGAELRKRGCEVTFADESNQLMPELTGATFRTINLDRDDIAALGKYNLVVCSNVLEHLAKPFEFIDSMGRLLEPRGVIYLSWTNWLSPWGGHEFSPFHYLGSRRGHLVYDRVTGRKRLHTPHVNLFPTHIGATLRYIRSRPGLRVMHAAPRYYPEFAWLLRLPVLREFLTWNCALLIQETGGSGDGWVSGQVG